MEVCADSSAAKAGASSSTRQTGQSLCPASACLASSGEEAAADWRGRGGVKGLNVASLREDVAALTRNTADRSSEATDYCSSLGNTFHLGRNGHSQRSYGGMERKNSDVAKPEVRPVAVGLSRERSDPGGTPVESSSQTAGRRGNQKSPCTECGKQFRPGAKMQRHLAAVHRGERNFHCSECGKKFSQSCNLKVHVSIVHRGKRNYVCPDCGKTFCSRSSMRGHLLRIHGNVDLYFCSECGWAFAQKRGLTSHLSTEHRGRFSCYGCGKKFDQKCKLSAHFRKSKKCGHK